MYLNYKSIMPLETIMMPPGVEATLVPWHREQVFGRFYSFKNMAGYMKVACTSLFSSFNMWATVNKYLIHYSSTE